MAEAATTPWHKVIAKATIHYGPRTCMSLLSIIAGARIRVRTHPDAPAVTGHTLAVCASAVFLGRTAATVGAALYAVAALAGLPVYRGYRGVHKPTIGYVVGFSACAWLAGSGKAKPLAVFLRCCVGQFATLLIGSVWLIFPGYAETLPEAWALGVRPYLRGALVKALLVSLAAACGEAVPWLTWRAGKWGLGLLAPLLFWRVICSDPVQRWIQWLDETTVADVWAWEPGGIKTDKCYALYFASPCCTSP